MLMLPLSLSSSSSPLRCLQLNVTGNFALWYSTFFYDFWCFILWVFFSHSFPTTLHKKDDIKFFGCIVLLITIFIWSFCENLKYFTNLSIGENRPKYFYTDCPLSWTSKWRDGTCCMHDIPCTTRHSVWMKGLLYSQIIQICMECFFYSSYFAYLWHISVLSFLFLFVVAVAVNILNFSPVIKIQGVAWMNLLALIKPNGTPLNCDKAMVKQRFEEQHLSKFAWSNSFNI